MSTTTVTYMLKLNMPIDNFYKFITFIGATLAVGVFTLLLNASEQLGRDAKEFIAETKSARMYMHQYISKASGLIKLSQDAGGMENLSEIEKQQALRTYAELTALREENGSVVEQGSIATSFFEKQIAQYARTRSFFIGTTYLGIAIFLVGAFFWYWRTQLPIDKQQSHDVAGTPELDATRIQT